MARAGFEPPPSRVHRPVTVDMLLLALAALGLNGKCGSYSSDPVPITHPLYKPSVRDVYDVYNSIAFTINIPEESWHTPTAAGASQRLVV